MKLILSDFEEGIPKQVEGSYDAKASEVEFQDLIYLCPITLKGIGEKTDVIFRLKGELTSEVKRVCGKCLKEKDEKISFNFDWIFDITGKEFIEPLENIRELLIIERPLVYLCKSDCKGLCSQCGKDLNDGACNCKENRYHSTPVIIKKSKSHKE